MSSSDAVRGSRRIGHSAHAAAGSPLAKYLVRAGYVARGIIYLVPGYLALRLALGIHGAAITQTGAIEYIAEHPFGRLSLVALAIGLAGYSLWGLIRAIFDPAGEGHDADGIARRLGFAGSALAYAGLFVATAQFLAGGVSHVARQRDWTATLLAQPFGHWLVGIVGVVWILGGGLTQIRNGWSRRFLRDLDLSRFSVTEREWAIRLGRFGIIARGVVFTIIGVLLISAAYHHDALEAKGMDGALMALARQPFGGVLLATGALGLIAFGLFSILCARWMKVSLLGQRPILQSHRSHL